MAQKAKKKDPTQKLVNDLFGEFNADIASFRTEAGILRKKMKEFMTKGKSLLEQAKEKKDFMAMFEIVYYLYHGGPKSEASLGHLESLFKDFPEETS